MVLCALSFTGAGCRVSGGNVRTDLKGLPEQRPVRPGDHRGRFLVFQLSSQQTRAYVLAGCDKELGVLPA